MGLAPWEPWREPTSRPPCHTAEPAHHALHAPAFHLFHHFLHLLVLLQQSIEILHCGTRTKRNPPLT